MARMAAVMVLLIHVHTFGGLRDPKFSIGHLSRLTNSFFHTRSWPTAALYWLALPRAGREGTTRVI